MHLTQIRVLRFKPLGSVPLFAALGVCCMTPGCRPPDRLAAHGRVPVAVSIVPQVWLVQAIGGDRVEAFAVVAPGENPHTYQPSDAQVSRLMGARVFFRMGVPFEKGPWFRALQKSDRLKIIDLRHGVPMRDMANEGHEEHSERHLAKPDHAAHDECCAVDGKDPHTWLAPRNLRIQAATVADALCGIDPAHADHYRENLKVLDGQLDQLERTIQAKLKPAAGQAICVFHPAWGYFADQFGLKQVAIEIDGRDPSDRELTDVAKRIRQAKARVIFVQPQISGRAADAIAQATGARVAVADPLATELPDELIRLATVFAEACSP